MGGTPGSLEEILTAVWEVLAAATPPLPEHEGHYPATYLNSFAKGKGIIHLGNVSQS